MPVPAVIGAPVAGPALGEAAPVRDSLEGLPIARITILPREVYETEDHGRIAPIHRLLNRLHIHTRPATVRQQLLFAPGQPWSDRLGRETGRNLRALNFLEPTRVAASGAGDSVDVVVETRDFWSTRAEINLESGGGHRYGSVGFTERNLLGLGKSLSLTFREDPSGKSRQVRFDDPLVLGTHHLLQIHTTRGTSGDGELLRFALPFYAEDARRAYELYLSRSLSVLNLYQAGEKAADLDRDLDQVKLSVGVRVGSGTPIQRVEAVFESEDRRLGASRLAPGAPPGFAGGPDEVRLRRLGAEWSVWRPRFVELVDVDRMDRVEDFDLGRRLAVRIGMATRALGSTSDEGYARVRLGAGAGGRRGVVWLSTAGSGRFLPEARELFVQADARAYLLTIPAHTVVVAAHGVAGARVERDFQAVVGGLDGLRAYGVQAVAGRRLWRLNFEDRWRFSPPDWRLVKLGAVAFVDAARGWGLGAAGTGWHHDAGVGLRIGLPLLGAAEVLRLDAAWPLAPLVDGRRSPVFSFGSSQAF